MNRLKRLIGLDFFKSMTVVDPITGCWSWLGTKDKRGYALRTFRVEKNVDKTFIMSRVSYYLFKGDFDRSLLMLHKCDNPCCVNPDHLFPGTQKENIADMDSKGRRGAARGIAKLTKEHVRVIRSLNGMFSQNQLAKVYGVSQAQIWRILTGLQRNQQ